MQVAGRLVGENQFRILDYRARHADKLLLPAGELAREQVFLSDDLEPVEAVTNQAYTLFARNVFVREGDLEILENCQVVDQVIALEDKADVGLVQLVALFDAQLVNRLFQKVELPAPRPVEHADDAQQRGLPRARGSHDGDEFAAVDLQRDPAQEKELVWAGLDRFFKIAHSNQGFHRCSASPVLSCAFSSNL